MNTNNAFIGILFRTLQVSSLAIILDVHGSEMFAALHLPQTEHIWVTLLNTSMFQSESRECTKNNTSKKLLSKYLLLLYSTEPIISK